MTPQIKRLVSGYIRSAAGRLRQSEVLRARWGMSPPRRVFVPEIELSEAPTIRLADIRRRRFSLIDRAQREQPPVAVSGTAPAPAPVPRSAPVPPTPVAPWNYDAVYALLTARAGGRDATV